MLRIIFFCAIKGACALILVALVTSSQPHNKTELSRKEVVKAVHDVYLSREKLSRNLKDRREYALLMYILVCLAPCTVRGGHLTGSTRLAQRCRCPEQDHCRIFIRYLRYYIYFNAWC